MPIPRSALKFWLLPLLWLVVISFASGDGESARHSSLLFEPLMRWLFPWMAQARIDNIHYVFRKCAHLAEFSMLALLFWQAVHHSLRAGLRPQQRWWLECRLSLALVLLCAASDEIHQTFVAGRTGQLSDVLVDTLGGAIGLGLLWLARKIFNCRQLRAKRLPADQIP